LDGLQANRNRTAQQNAELEAAINNFTTTKNNMFDAAKGLYQYAKEYGIQFNFGTDYNEAANTAHNADRTAYSPVYNGRIITTLYGYNAVNPEVATVTGRDFGQTRNHKAYDVSGGLFVAPSSGTVDMEWAPGEGIRLTVRDERYLHQIGHNFSATAERLMELLVTNGTLEVKAGTVIGSYQKFKSNQSTGDHAHWAVFTWSTDKEGRVIEKSIDNAQWARENGLGNLFKPTEEALHYSGLPNELTPEAGRQLYRKYNPEVYYDWLGRTNFGVPGITTPEVYKFYEEHLSFLRRGYEQ